VSGSARRFAAAAVGLTLVVSAAILSAPSASAVVLHSCFDSRTGKYVPATIVGTDNADYIVGTTGDDVIQANDGDDTVRGLAGNDIVCGDSDNDLVNGGKGNDFVSGGTSNDEIQSSDPWVYCSTADSGFSAVSTAFRTPTDLAFSQCNPANGPVASAETIPDDGAIKPLFMDLPSTTQILRDINIRIYVNAPKVDGAPDPCQLRIGLSSPNGTTSSMLSRDCNDSGTDLTGTTFDSEAITTETIINTTNLPMDGRFHPSESLDLPYRNTNVCSGGSCIWKLSLSDEVPDGNAGTVSWWAIEINYGDGTGDGSDVVNCGTGANDTIDYTARNKPLTVTLNNTGPNDGQAGEGDDLGADDANRCEWLYTGFGKDNLTGNSVYNDIRGSQGDDTITTLAGADRTRGGGGNDKQYGGDGDDKLEGNDGSDTSDGGPGTDRCLNSEIRISCEATS
jgi:Ca2+-binding RTX toxin-like protein